MNNLEDEIVEEAKARLSFKRHLQVYLAVNALTWVLWFLMRAKNGHYDGFWPLYSTLGWGFGLLSHYFGVYHKGGTALDKEVKKIKKERGLD